MTFVATSRLSPPTSLTYKRCTVSVGVCSASVRAFLLDVGIAVQQGFAAALNRSFLRPSWVTCGKPSSGYIFSGLPQVADIFRSAFHHLGLVLQITAFWV